MCVHILGADCARGSTYDSDEAIVFSNQLGKMLSNVLHRGVEHRK